MQLDAFDRQLLNLVQEDASQTAEQLAEQVALSPSAIQRRLRRMRDAGVIVKDVSVLAPEKIGGRTFFVVALQIERERPEVVDQLRRWLARASEIQQVYYVTGEADFVLVISARDSAAYGELMKRLVEENPNVKRFTTSVVLDVLKRGLRIQV